MRRVTIVIPYLVSDPEVESAMRPLPPAMKELVEGGSLVRLRQLPDSSCPEAAFLGLDPQEHPISQGPLTVACLGHRPPERSVHFHLTLASVNEDGTLGEASDKPTEEELRAVLDAVESLRTKSLTPLVGEACDHALVWENGSLENETVPFSSAAGTPTHASLPKGEGENILRQFIDDSINLLNSLEINHVRREDGLTPLNCLWPWGQGLRPDLPNLPLRRGDVAQIESDSMRLHGLANLVGYRHGDRSKFKKGMAADFGRLYAVTRRSRLTLAHVETVREMQTHGRVDEMAWTLEQASAHLIDSLLANAKEEPFELRIALPSGHCGVEPPPERASKTGLGLTYSSAQQNSNSIPFDERSLDEAKLPVVSAHNFVLGGLLGTIE